MSRDDPKIQDAEVLLRRIHPSQLVWNDNNKDWAVSSAAWDDATGDISVYLSSSLLSNQLAPECVLDGYPLHSLASITAGDARGLDEPLGVILDPDPNDDHPRSKCHGLLTGLLPGNPGKKRQQRPLAKKSKILVLRK